MQEELLTRRLREIRHNKGLTLEKLASLTGLSKGYLSQIENSYQPPPIYTLARISNALGIDVSDLFTHTPAPVSYEKIVVGRRDEHRPSLGRGEATSVRSGYIYEDLAPSKKGKNMEPFIVTVGFDTKIDVEKDFRHEGEEFNYVLEGKLEFFYEGKSYCILDAGDHVYFDADKAHSARSLGEIEAKVLIIIYSYKRL